MNIFRCLAVMNNPYDLGCREQHNFCHACLKELFKQSYHNKVSCPICKQSNLKESNIKKNIYIKRIINNLKLNKCPHGCKAKHFTVGNLKIHEQKYCDKYFIECTNKCGLKILNKKLQIHLKSECRLRKFFTTNLTPFIDEHKSNLMISKDIKAHFEGLFNTKFMVFVNDINSKMGYHCSYKIPFQRTESVKNKYICIYGQILRLNELHKGNIMTRQQFKAFFTGLVLNIMFLRRHGELKDVKQNLDDVLGGNYAVFQNNGDISYTYYCDHSCEINIMGVIFRGIRTG